MSVAGLRTNISLLGQLYILHIKCRFSSLVSYWVRRFFINIFSFDNPSNNHWFSFLKSHWVKRFSLRHNNYTFHQSLHTLMLFKPHSLELCLIPNILLSLIHKTSIFLLGVPLGQKIFYQWLSSTILSKIFRFFFLTSHLG